MRAEQLMTKQVKWCGPNDTLDCAARLMWDYDCGCLPVCEVNGGQRTVGLITDRDICMSALFHGQPLTALRVSDAMAKSVHVCKAEDSISDVEKVMREARIRRLPVVDSEGSLIGILALADLARSAAQNRGAADREVTEGEVGDTLAAICQPTQVQTAA